MKRTTQQLSLNVRMYVAKVGGFGDIPVQAATSAAAKYQIYKRGRDAGFFTRGFRDFLSRGFSVRAMRR